MLYEVRPLDPVVLGGSIFTIGRGDAAGELSADAAGGEDRSDCGIAV